MKIRIPGRAVSLNSNKGGRPFGYTPGSKQLNALWKHGVQPNCALNPYGKFGNSHRARYRATWFKMKLKPAFRDLPHPTRVRAKLEEKKARALEAHELQLLSRENALAALQTLIEISGNQRAPENTRIAASVAILDRAYGKASQTSITASVTNGKKSDLDGNELDKRISQALKRAEELTNRTPKEGKSEERPVNLRKYN